MKKVYAHDGTRAFCHLGRTQVRMGYFLSNCCGAEAASPLAQKQVDAVGGQWSVCGVRRWGEKGRIIVANKAYLPDFMGNLVVDKRAVVIAKTAILSVLLRTA
ncbi:hypothetical protein [Alloprevotella tannerae]|uniref:hypothetical protein n=1 Tax=Alloprevotella tannerae TaxID=76122 RepID=UPI00288B5A26|nr:hypothetical protein [Alloprevotella tannerae]